MGSKCTKSPQNWPQRLPPGTAYFGSVSLYIIWGYFGHFVSEKGVKLAPNWPQLLAVWLLNGLQFVPKGPKMTPKQPQQYSIVVVSTTVHYLGAFRSFLGEERVETSPKLLIWITYVAWFLNFGQP